MDLASAHDELKLEAARLAGGPGDMPQRVAVLHALFEDSGRNHAFPEVALHGALWGYSFYERRGAISRTIAYRYHGVLPERFFADPVRYADQLRAAVERPA